VKKCTACGETKARSEFSRHRRNGDGLQSQCKQCRAKWLRQHRVENPDVWVEYDRRYKATNYDKIRAQANARYAADPESARRHLGWKLKRKYDLTLEEYDRLMAMPCGICGITAMAGARIVLDHCHDTGKVRGPLCQACNTGIGKLGDDPAQLRVAADYLERYR
jgi:hypothetical protein